MYTNVTVYEDINSTRVKFTETCVAMKMADTKLGFTRMRLLHCNNNIIWKLCTKVGNDLYLSSQLCKSMYIGVSKETDAVHGPCLSDINGYLDLAFTLHSRQWVVNGMHVLPPVVFSHFLLFLCHLRLSNVNQCYNSLRDLQLTISENYFISNNRGKSNSYNCLGVAYQLIGKRVLAEHAFHLAIYLDPTWNCALHRLSMEREKRTQEMTELVPYYYEN